MALSSDLVAALGWALLDFVWQGLVLGALAAAALLLLRSARPQARYAVACIALAACLVLPLAGVWREMQDGDAIASAAATGNSISDVFAVAAPIATPVPAEGWRTTLQARMPAIVAAWSAGAMLLALRLLLGCGWVGRLRAGARLPASHWQGRFDQLAVHVGLRAPVPLRVSDAIDSPVAAGWWQPVVLVPAALLAGMSPELLEALLAHELAHVRRRDYLVNLLQGAVETLLFYHPVVWWLSRRARTEREQIADDLASRAIGDPRRLALALQALDRHQAQAAAAHPHPRPSRPPRASGLVLAAHGGNLMSRIKRLLRPDRQRPDWKLALPLAALAALGLAVHAAQATAPAAIVPPVAATPAVAAAPSVAAAPVAAATAAAAGAVVVGEGERQPYALVHDGEDGMMLSGSLQDMADVRRARQHLHGDFLWFRRDGDGYVVQDPALLTRASQAWAPATELGAKMDALSQQMRPHSERMDALGKQMEALGKRGDPYAQEMAALGDRMEPLARQQAELGEQMRGLAETRRGEADDARIEAAMQQLQSKMDGLGAQMEALSRAMEEKGELMRRAQGPMEQLGRQMEAASKPMEALGAQLEVLGKQQEALTHAADAEMVRLIDDALREGKAAPSREISH